MNVDPSGLASVGQILDDSAMRAASLNNTLQLAALSFAKVTWDVFGAENISRWADGQITSRIGLGIETAAAIPFVGPAVKIGKAANFTGNASLLSHFGKHGAEFGAKSASDYLNIGREIILVIKCSMHIKVRQELDMHNIWEILRVAIQSLGLLELMQMAL